MTPTDSSRGGMATIDNPMRDESIGELMKQLAHDTATLVRQEFELAKAETTEKGKKAGPGIGMFGGAGLLALLGAGALTATFIAAIAEATPVWVAALIVAVAYFAIAGGLAFVGKNKVQEALPAAPEQTIETLKEDVAWAKTQVKSARR